MGWVLIALAVVLMFVLPPLLGSKPRTFREYLDDLWDFTKFFGTFLLAIGALAWLLVTGLYMTGLVH